MKNHILRANLIELLRSEQAHVTAEKALADTKPDLRNVRPEASAHSVWELLDHMRIAQEDILRYTLDASWKSPDFPDGYWPANTKKLTENMWSTCKSTFFADLDKVAALTQDPNIDLFAKIPHGEGRTYLREILLVADHNAYHLGQIIQTRRILGDWPAQKESMDLLSYPNSDFKQ